MTNKGLVQAIIQILCSQGFIKKKNNNVESGKNRVSTVESSSFELKTSSFKLKTSSFELQSSREKKKGGKTMASQMHNNSLNLGLNFKPFF